MAGFKAIFDTARQRKATPPMCYDLVLQGSHMHVQPAGHTALLPPEGVSGSGSTPWHKALQAMKKCTRKVSIGAARDSHTFLLPESVSGSVTTLGYEAPQAMLCMNRIFAP